eukprot:TRINITY_DN68374_c0_g1_i1.p1 TRINITY_DN68374_c0_g1~~TRINITY_DN68374_c0_g1_i1.p1  ORF type:complete len:416 (-),score=51.02 TRINITY_DN68374_c0_g1_i1:47-1294(-)
MSWIAYPEDHPFPIQNLPYGAFKLNPDAEPRLGVAIGDSVVDLYMLAENNLVEDPIKGTWQKSTLNDFMALGKQHWQTARKTLQKLLSKDDATIRDNKGLRADCIHEQSQVQLVMPIFIRDYTDFYSSKEHATNLGKLFRPTAAPLLPNWTHIPVGYHGRASSIVVSGTNFKRPKGQTRPDDSAPPVYGQCQKLDFELEMAFFVGPKTELGSPIPVETAEDHIFGLALFNDWSARDIQKWEYVPLGPFLGKNFCSTISPWIVTLEALQPFRCKSVAQEPEVLPYLKEPGDGSYNINLAVTLTGKDASEPYTLCKSNHKYLYWTMRQQLAHHTVNGCNVNPGDCMASGTISGPNEGEVGSMLELTWNGTKPIKLANGEERKMLQDGDTVTMTGYCQGDGFRVGFGDCVSTILPADP